MSTTLLLRQHPQQPVPDAPHVLDEGDGRAGVAKLAPQPGCVRVERPRPAGRPIVPDLLQELRLREDAPRLPREAGEELELLLRELDAATGHAHLACRQVDAHGRRVEHLGGRRPCATKNGTDPLDELLVVERRRDEVVAAAAERVHPVDRVGRLAAEHDHGRPRDPALDGVEIAREDEVRTALRSDELEPVALQAPLEEAVRLGLGVGEEQRCRGCHAPDGTAALTPRLVVLSHDCAPIAPQAAGTVTGAVASTAAGPSCRSRYVSHPYNASTRNAFTGWRPPAQRPTPARIICTNVRIGTTIDTARTRALGCHASSATMRKSSAPGVVRMNPSARCASRSFEFAMHCTPCLLQWSESEMF